jgi:hypothetical protein
VLDAQIESWMLRRFGSSASSSSTGSSVGSKLT